MDKVVINQTGQVLIYQAYGFEEQAIAQLHPNALMGMIPVYVHHCVPGECNVFSLQPIRLSDVELMDAMAQVNVGNVVEFEPEDGIDLEIGYNTHIATYSISVEVAREIVEGNFTNDQVHELIRTKGIVIPVLDEESIFFDYTDKETGVEELIAQLVTELE